MSSKLNDLLPLINCGEVWRRIVDRPTFELKFDKRGGLGVSGAMQRRRAEGASRLSNYLRAVKIYLKS
jgi:hypothetical protein